jgi:hypothetical protein
MRTFKAMTTSDGEVCPLCNTADAGEIVLIPIQGTVNIDNVEEAIQVHTKCIQERWIFSEEFNVILVK